jgi:hypothetical protein
VAAVGKGGDGDDTNSGDSDDGDVNVEWWEVMVGNSGGSSNSNSGGSNDEGGRGEGTREQEREVMINTNLDSWARERKGHVADPLSRSTRPHL